MSAAFAYQDSDNNTTLDQIYSREEGVRNFDLFPGQELSELVSLIDQEVPTLELKERLDYYFAELSKIGCDEQLKANVGHFIASFLRYCLETKRPWAAQFFFPPQLDAGETEIEIAGKSDKATKHYKEVHIHRNASWLSDYLLMMLDNPMVLFINGPMYSAKSGAAAILYSTLQPIIARKNITPLIFGDMKESNIHARSLDDGDISAECVDMGTFETKVNHLLETVKPGERHLVIVEEAAFITSDLDPEVEDAKAKRFCELVNKLKEHGMRVILIGLDKNYRGTDLALTRHINGGDLDAEPLACKSFHLYPYDGRPRTSEADRTGRYSTILNGFDVFFPILIPRNIGDLIQIEYTPLPHEYHPFEVIRMWDPELHTRMINIQRDDLLKNQCDLVNQKAES